MTPELLFEYLMVILTVFVLAFVSFSIMYMLMQIVYVKLVKVYDVTIDCFEAVKRRDK